MRFKTDTGTIVSVSLEQVRFLKACILAERGFYDSNEEFWELVKLDFCEAENVQETEWLMGIIKEASKFNRLLLEYNEKGHTTYAKFNSNIEGTVPNVYFTCLFAKMFLDLFLENNKEVIIQRQSFSTKHELCMKYETYNCFGPGTHKKETFTEAIFMEEYLKRLEGRKKAGQI